VEQETKQIDRVVVGYDWSRGRDWTVYRCACGFETDTMEGMLPHVEAHGARVIAITPMAAAPPDFFDQVRRG
jgi:predicted dithiol-disulfide oxidoreductase (DUF899 family)